MVFIVSVHTGTYAILSMEESKSIEYGCCVRMFMLHMYATTVHYSFSGIYVCMCSMNGAIGQRYTYLLSILDCFGQCNLDQNDKLAI